MDVEEVEQIARRVFDKALLDLTMELAEARRHIDEATLYAEKLLRSGNKDLRLIGADVKELLGGYDDDVQG